MTRKSTPTPELYFKSLRTQSTAPKQSSVFFLPLTSLSLCVHPLSTYNIIGPATSSRFSWPARIPTIVKAHSIAVPGPRLVMANKSCTARGEPESAIDRMSDA